MENINPIIIDTDPGVDDALALLLAITAKIPISGIISVFGNVSIENTTRNALTILELLNADIPVYKGASRPLKGKGIIASSHGKNGLGNFTKSLKTRPKVQSAQQWLNQVLTKNTKYTYICLGPTTNLASAIKKNPAIAKNLDQVIILGGVINQKGNITPYAEFNVYNDPTALSFLLSLSCPKVLIPINICRTVTFTQEDFLNIQNSTIRDAVKSITDLYISYYTSNTYYGTFSGGVMYDLLAITVLLRPHIFKTIPAYIQVETNITKRYGQTTKRNNKKSNCSLVVDVDSEQVKKTFFEMVNIGN